MDKNKSMTIIKLFNLKNGIFKKRILKFIEDLLQREHIIFEDKNFKGNCD